MRPPKFTSHGCALKKQSYNTTGIMLVLAGEVVCFTCILFLGFLPNSIEKTWTITMITISIVFPVTVTLIVYIPRIPSALKKRKERKELEYKQRLDKEERESKKMLASEDVYWKSNRDYYNETGGKLQTEKDLPKRFIEGDPVK